MGNPPLSFLRDGEKYPYNGKGTLNMHCFGCITKQVVLVFILTCLMAFGNLDFLDLPFGVFIFNVCRKKYHLRNFGKTKGRNFGGRGLFAEFSFAIYDPPHRNLFQKKLKSMLYLPNNAAIFKGNIKKNGHETNFYSMFLGY